MTNTNHSKTNLPTNLLVVLTQVLANTDKRMEFVHFRNDLTTQRTDPSRKKQKHKEEQTCLPLTRRVKFHSISMAIKHFGYKIHSHIKLYLNTKYK